MKKRNTRTAIAAAAVVLLCVAVALFYSRPMTLLQRYPMLDPDKCTELHGYYEIGMQAEQTEFIMEKDSDEFQALCSVFYEQEYRRSLRDLLPRGGRSHRTEPDDYRWDVVFRFEEVGFSDGSVGSGDILRIQNWYGELDIHFAGEQLSCHTKEQALWAAEVLDILLNTPTR